MDRDFRQEALRQAFAEDPELAARTDPEGLALLEDLVQRIEGQLRLQAEVEDLRRREFAEQARKAGEQAKIERDKAEREAAEERARLQREATQQAAARAAEEHRLAERERKRQEREREERIASMSPLRRFLLRFWIPVSIAFVVLVVFPAIAGAWIFWQHQQQRAALASCDWANFEQVREDPTWAEKWIQCEGEQFRADVIANAPGDFFTTERISNLLQDESSVLRQQVIQRAPGDFFTTERISNLLQDESSLVRRELIARAPVEFLAQDGVLNRITDEETLPSLQRRVLSTPGAFSVDTLIFMVEKSDMAFRSALSQHQALPTEVTQLINEVNYAEHETACKPAEAAISLAVELGREEQLLESWASCDSPNMRSWIARQAKTSTKVLSALAEDPSKDVRKGVAWNKNTPGRALIILANDPDPEVRAALVTRQKLPTAILQSLLTDEDVSVRAAMLDKGSTAVRRFLAESAPTQRERNAAMKKLFGELCGKNLKINSYLADTTWKGSFRGGRGDDVLTFRRDCSIIDERRRELWDDWRQDGNTVRWGRRSGNVYTGTVSGNILSGRSANGPFRFELQW